MYHDDETGGTNPIQNGDSWDGPLKQFVDNLFYFRECFNLETDASSYRYLQNHQYIIYSVSNNLLLS